MFHQALKVCPINELQGKKLNSNGVFVKDFLVCAKSYAIENAFRELEPALRHHYPSVEHLSYKNETIFLFLQSRAAIDDFLRVDVKTCKKLCYEIIAPFDVEDVWRLQELKVMLDTYDVYQSIGGGNYFRSDAMYAGILI